MYVSKSLGGLTIRPELRTLYLIYLQRELRIMLLKLQCACTSRPGAVKNADSDVTILRQDPSLASSSFQGKLMLLIPESHLGQLGSNAQEEETEISVVSTVA